MKKFNKVLSYIFLVGVIVSLFGIINILAQDDKLKVTNAVISEKSVDVTTDILDFSDNKINNKVVFHHVGDYVVYDVTIKNTDSKDYYIKSITDDNNSPFISYEYNEYKDQKIAANSDITIKVKARYSKSQTNIEDRVLNFDVKFKINYSDEDPNPYTFDNINLFLIFGLISLIGLIVTLAINHKLKRVMPVIVGLLLIPITVFALNFEFTFTLKNNYHLKDKLKVTYHNDGNETIDIIEYGKTLVLPANPDKTGYTFDGWYTDPDNGEKVDESESVKDDMDLYSHFTANELIFNDQVINSTYSTSKITTPIAPATNGTGDYTYSVTGAKDSSDNDVIYFDVEGNNVAIKGGTPAGTYTVSLKALDNNSLKDKEATYTFNIAKQKVGNPSNLAAKPDGDITWDEPDNATDSVISFDCTNYTSATSGDNFLAELTATADDKTVCVKATNSDPDNYEDSDPISITVEIKTVTFNVNNDTYGTVNPINLNVIKGVVYSTNANIFTLTDSRSVTATLTEKTGYTTTFESWSTESGTFADDATVIANFNQTANPYTIVFNKNATDATGSMSDQDMTYDIPANLNALGYERTGYTFAGWAESTDGNVVYTDGAEVVNLATSGSKILYAKWNANPLSFPDKPFFLTYSTSAQNLNVDPAANGTGSYTYTKTSGDANITVATNGSITIPAGLTAGTHTIVIKASDDNSGSTKDATYTFNIAKQKVDSPSNLVVAPDGDATWDPSDNATGYEFSLDCTNYASATSGDNFLSELTATADDKTVCVKAVNDDTTNYDESDPISTTVEIKTITFNTNNASYGTVNPTTLNVIKGVSYSVNTTTFNLIDGRTATANVTEKIGYTTTFNVWSTQHGTVNDDLTVTANFNQTANPYTIVFNKNATDATGSMSDQDMIYDVPANLNTLGYERTGYTFAGWAESTDGNVVYTDGAEVVNLATTGSKILYAKWDANDLTFNDKTINKTYSTSAQTANVDSATNGTGDYSYAKASGDAGINVANDGTITIVANTNAGTHTIVITATDNNSGSTKDATYTFEITKQKVGNPSNLTVAPNGDITWDEPDNATGSEISLDCTNYASATSGDNFLAELTATDTDKTVCLKAVNDDTTNYDESDVITKTVEIITIEFDYNHNYGTLTSDSLYAIKGVHYSTNSNKFSLNDGRSVTATPINVDGYTTTFASWSAHSGVLNDDGMFAAYFTRTANLYSIVFNKNADDATGSMSNQDMTYGVAANLNNNTYTREGYEFIGWATSANGAVVYTDGQSVNNLATSGNFNLYAKWNGNELSFNDKTINKTYSTSVQTDAVDPATNGTGNYSYAKASGDANITVANDGTITIAASLTAGTHTVVITATDNNSGITKDATYTIEIAKQQVNNATNLAVSPVGDATWNESDNATGYEFSYDCTNYVSATSGDNFLNELIADGNDKTVCLKTINDDTENYENPVDPITLVVPIHHVTYNVNDDTYGSVNVSDMYVIDGLTYSVNSNVLTTQDNRTVTAIAGTQTGFEITFVNWSSAAGTFNDDTTITANFDRSSNELTFADQSFNKTYSTSIQTENVVPATNGTGVYTYTKKSGDDDISVTPDGTIVLNAGINAGTHTVVITVNDSLSLATKDATYTFEIAKQKVNAPSNLNVAPDGDAAWIPSDNATGYEISFDCINYTSASIGDNFLTELTSDSDDKTVCLKAVNSDTTNYDESDVINTTVTINTILFAVNDNTYGTVNPTSLNVINGVTYSTNSNKLNIADGRTVTATLTEKTGYTTTFNSWSSTSGSFTTDETVIANFDQTANQYSIVFNKNATDATGSMSNQNMTYDQAANLNSIGYIREGYTFAGWAILPDGEVIYTNGAEVVNLATTGSTILYAKWTANDLVFNDKTINKTYSTSAQTDAVDPATNGTGDYSYSKKSGDAGITVANDGTITINAGLNAGTHTIVITATDNNSGATKDATYTIEVAKQKVGNPSNPAAEPDGDITWIEPTNATDSEISFDCTNYTSANSGDNFLAELTTTADDKTVCIKTINDDTDNYEESDPISITVEIKTITFNVNNSNYGTVSESSLNVIKGVSYSISSNVFNIADGRSVTATKKNATGYTTTFSSWSSTTGTFDDDETITANFTRTANSYTIVFDKNADDATGSMSDQDMTYGVSANLHTNTYERTGYTFAGWATSKNGSVVYTDGESVKNLATSGTKTLYARWTGDDLIFNDNTINVTYSTSAQTDTVDPATNGTGDYSYAKASGDAGITVDSDGTITIAAGLSAGTHTVVITATDNNSSATADATYTIEVAKQKVNNPTNLVVATNGDTTWNPSDNATGYEISFDCTNYVSASSGDNFLAELTTTADDKTVCLKAVNDDTTNYDESDVINTIVEIKTIIFNVNNNNYGTVSPTTLNVIKGVTYSTSSNVFNIADGRSVTATKKNATGYTTTFSSWSSTTGTFNVDETITANFTRTAKSYSIVFNKNADDATGSMSNQDMTYGVAANLHTNGYTRAGYEFAGWATSADGEVIYADQAEVINLATSGNFNLYAKWSTNNLVFNNKTINKTYSTSAQTANVEPATNGTGDYSYAKASGDAGITVANDGTITIAASLTAGTHTVVITATDNNSGVTKDATYTIEIAKQQVNAPTNLTIATNGNITWTNSNNATGYEISFDGTSYTSTTNGSNYLTELTNTNDSKTVYVRAINSDTTNYITPSSDVSKNVIISTLNVVSDNIAKGNVDVSSLNVINGATYTTSSNVLTLNDSRTVTATAETGYHFDSWSSASGTINSTTNITAIFAANDDTDYTVNHYIHDLGTNTYTLDSTDNLTGTTDSSLTLSSLKKSIDGFTYSDGYLEGNTTKPTSGAVTTTTILPDGSRVINLYYRRNYLYIQYDMNGGYLSDEHGEAYSTLNSLITHSNNTEPTYFLSGVYGSQVGGVNRLTYEINTSQGLANYNNASAINIDKAGYTAKVTEEWNTLANGNGTSYNQDTLTYLSSDFADLSSGDQVVTLYVNWKYNVTPVITFDDYNTFTYSANGASKYLVSTSNTVPTSTTSGWTTDTTTGDLTLEEGVTYYVWAQDSNGQISPNSAQITVKTITVSQGTGSTIIAKYDSSTGSNISFVNNKANVLNGTTIYVEATANTGYTTPELMKGEAIVTNGDTHTINSDVTFTSSATGEQITIKYSCADIMPNYINATYTADSGVTYTINNGVITVPSASTNSYLSQTSFQDNYIYLEAGHKYKWNATVTGSDIIIAKYRESNIDQVYMINMESNDNYIFTAEHTGLYYLAVKYSDSTTVISNMSIIPVIDDQVATYGDNFTLTDETCAYYGKTHDSWSDTTSSSWPIAWHTDNWTYLNGDYGITDNTLNLTATYTNNKPIRIYYIANGGNLGANWTTITYDGIDYIAKDSSTYFYQVAETGFNLDVYNDEWFGLTYPSWNLTSGAEWCDKRYDNSNKTCFGQDAFYTYDELAAVATEKSDYYELDLWPNWTKSNLSINPNSGTVSYGINETATIITSSPGALSCTSSKVTKASCSISGNTLTVSTPWTDAIDTTAVITVTQEESGDYPAGSATYNVRIHNIKVSFDPNGGTGGQSASVVATLGQAMPAISTTDPVKTGYSFVGWYDNTNYLNGTRYYKGDGTSARAWDKTEDTVLYAGWKAKESTITFDLNGATSGTAPDNVTATYDKAMPTLSTTTAPTRTGYTFMGWYDNADYTNGTKYYKADGTSARKWDKAGANKTLYAGWKVNTYTVTLNQNGGTGGKSSVTATYGEEMPTITSLPTRTNYTFKGYYDNADYTQGTKYYNADGTSARTYKKVTDSTLYARWDINQANYTVNHYKHKYGDTKYTLYKTETKSGDIGSTITVSTLKKSITGFTYEGGYTASAGNTTKPTADPTTTTTVKADGSRVINIYYRPNHLYTEINTRGGQLAAQHANGITQSGNYLKYYGGDFLRGAYNMNFTDIDSDNYTQGTDGPLDWANPNAVNIEKAGYHAKPGEEWYCKVGDTKIYFNQDDGTHSANDVCGVNLAEGDQTITLYVNWEAD